MFCDERSCCVNRNGILFNALHNFIARLELVNTNSDVQSWVMSLYAPKVLALLCRTRPVEENSITLLEVMPTPFFVLDRFTKLFTNESTDPSVPVIVVLVHACKYMLTLAVPFSQTH
jgi:hypothetical protein